MNNPLDSSIALILKDWNTLYKKVREFSVTGGPYHNDVQYTLPRVREYFAYVEKYLPILQSWAHTFLQEHKEEIFLRYWLQESCSYLRSTINDHRPQPLHPRFLEEWDPCVNAKGELTSWEANGVTFTRIKERAIYAYKNRDLSYCSIPEIQERDPNHDCKDCCGFICWDYEEREEKWRRYLQDEVTEGTNVFGNSRLHQPFITDALAKQAIQVTSTWSPPIQYSYNKIDTKEEWLEDRIKSRKERYHSAYENRPPVTSSSNASETIEGPYSGLTPRQCMEHFINYLAWDWHFYINPEDAIGSFLQIWPFLEKIPELLKIDLPYLEHIEQFFISPPPSITPFRRSTAAVKQAVALD